MTRALYTPGGEHDAIENFFDAAYADARDASRVDGSVATLDSVSVTRFSKDRTASLDRSSIAVPASVQKVLDAVNDESQRHKVLDSVLMGMDYYRREHGVLPTADVLDYALHDGFVATKRFSHDGAVLDGVGTTEHSDSLGAQPNRIVVAITSAIAEAFPAATYLPADIGSNWARLGIVSHLAGTQYGDYNQNDLMDGVAVGQNYVSAGRYITLTQAAGTGVTNATGQISGSKNNVQPIAILRYRTIIYVNGYPCAFESPTTPSSATNSPISGFVTIGSTQYAISGAVTPGTGAIAITFTPQLPANQVVTAEGFVDFENPNNPSPEVITQATTYDLYATPWRVRVRNSIDSKTQYANELGMDLASEALIAIRNQYAMERHYDVLNKAIPLALTNTTTWDMAYSTQVAHKTRAMMLQDFQTPLGEADQQMANDTMDHGITHLYVGKNFAAMLLSMPDTLFQPSGLVARPGIYRVGTLFGRYEVYYNPRIVETSTTSQVIAIGRSTQVARCPFVLGDAVPPTYIPLSVNDDLRFGSAFYARSFTNVNPHQPSSKGVAVINIINMN